MVGKNHSRTALSKSAKARSDVQNIAQVKRTAWWKILKEGVLENYPGVYGYGARSGTNPLRFPSGVCKQSNRVGQNRRRHTERSACRKTAIPGAALFYSTRMKR